MTTYLFPSLSSFFPDGGTLHWSSRSLDVHTPYGQNGGGSLGFEYISPLVGRAIGINGGRACWVLSLWLLYMQLDFLTLESTIWLLGAGGAAGVAVLVSVGAGGVGLPWWLR